MNKDDSSSFHKVHKKNKTLRHKNFSKSLSKKAKGGHKESLYDSKNDVSFTDMELDDGCDFLFDEEFHLV